METPNFWLSPKALTAEHPVPDTIQDGTSRSQCDTAAAPLRSCHTRCGVTGMSMWRSPVRDCSALTIALITAGGAPTLPASPAPLTPSGFAVEGTLRVAKAKDGMSPARGIA